MTDESDAIRKTLGKKRTRILMRAGNRWKEWLKDGV